MRVSLSHYSWSVLFYPRVTVASPIGYSSSITCLEAVVDRALATGSGDCSVLLTFFGLGLAGEPGSKLSMNLGLSCLGSRLMCMLDCSLRLGFLSKWGTEAFYSLLTH